MLEPLELGITITDDETGDSTDFVVVVLPQHAVFNDARHARNFAKYLHRAGGERPNDRTHLNRRWHAGGSDTSADHRQSEGAQSLAQLSDLFVRIWQDLENDLCYFFPALNDQAPATDAQARQLYRYAWEQAAGRAVPRDVLVTHHDQTEPVHVHRVRMAGAMSLYEALVIAGVGEGIGEEEGE